MLKLSVFLQQVAAPGLPQGLTIAPFDGVSELWFDNLDSVIAAMASPNYAKIAAADGDNFLDRSKTLLLLSEERTDIWMGK